MLFNYVMFRSANIHHLMTFLSRASCSDFDVCFLVFKKNAPIAIRNWQQTRNLFWLHLLMCFISKKITAVLFWDYQWSIIVQMRCELTKLSQQQIFQITIISNYQSVSVKRKSPPFIIKLKTFLTNKRKEALFCRKVLRKRRCLYFESP